MDLLSKYAHLYLKDSVYAASDGAVAIFALVAGITGASLHSSVVLILGFASVFANAFSMGTANFLGSRSEEEMYARRRRLQEEESQAHPEHAEKDIADMLSEMGYTGKEHQDLTQLIMRDKNFAVDLMVEKELGIVKPKKGRPLQGGIITFVAFTLAGIIPLLPYAAFLQGGTSDLFFIAIVFTAAELFALGVLRSVLTDRSWFASGLETLVLGGIAAAIAFGIGSFLRGVAGDSAGLAGF